MNLWLSQDKRFNLKIKLKRIQTAGSRKDCRMGVGEGDSNTRRQFCQKVPIVIQEEDAGNMDYG